MIKKLKKKVTVKSEEGGEPGKSLNQEDENIEIEQQINIEEKLCCTSIQTFTGDFPLNYVQNLLVIV